MSRDYQDHVERSARILARYPEIRQWFRPYPLSLVPITVLVALQWGIAWAVADLPWWSVGLVAFGIGQFVLHSLSTFLHEAAHSRVLPTRGGSMFVLWVIELGTLSFAKSATYVARHGPSHHRYLNDYLRDYEWWDAEQVGRLRSRVEWRIFDALLQLLPLGMLVSDLLVAAFGGEDRRRRIREVPLPVWFRGLLMATSLGLYLVAWRFLGFGAALYFVWSVSFMVGLWGITFKGQSIAEHDVEGKGRTYSTYGWVNRVFFNTGYHDEHHTFPQVPWIDLPKVREVAWEDFQNDSGRDYVGWWAQWAGSLFAPGRFQRYRPSNLPPG